MHEEQSPRRKQRVNRTQSQDMRESTRNQQEKPDVSLKIHIITKVSIKRRWLKSHSSKVFFPSPKHPDGLWGPHSLIFNGYWGPSPGIKAAGA
jgi:hypothetical protein